MDEAPEPSIPRHFGMDWLRVGAFGLLILYHVGMVFSPWHWVVKSSHRAEALAFPMLALNPWRIPLLFMVSGYATRAILARHGAIGRLARERSVRLLLPLAFGIAVIVPPQSWVRLVAAHGYPHGYLHFWAVDYFRFGMLDGLYLPSSEHLWFVEYLWSYTMLLCALLALGGGGRLTAAVGRLAPGRRLLWAPLLLLLGLRFGLSPLLRGSTGALGEWAEHVAYFPIFLFGFALAAHPPLWAAATRLRHLAAASAASALAVIFAFELRYPGDTLPPHLPWAVLNAAKLAMIWGMMLVMLDVAQRRLNRDHRWRAPLCEAVFPIYLLHQTAIVLIAWWIVPRGIGAAGEAALILAGTTLACWLFYALGRRGGPLRPLIGLKAVRRRG